MKCQSFACPHKATVVVRGGRRSGETVGWYGEHCEKCAVLVVQHHLIQVPAGMPIHVEPLPRGKR